MCVHISIFTVYVITSFSCHTDIFVAQKCAMASLLVLTGVSNLEDVERYKKRSGPDDKFNTKMYLTFTVMISKTFSSVFRIFFYYYKNVPVDHILSFLINLYIF